MKQGSRYLNNNVGDGWPVREPPAVRYEVVVEDVVREYDLKDQIDDVDHGTVDVVLAIKLRNRKSYNFVLEAWSKPPQ